MGDEPGQILDRPRAPLSGFNFAANVLAHLPIEVDERSVYGVVGVLTRRSDQCNDLGEAVGIGLRHRQRGPLSFGFYCHALNPAIMVRIRSVTTFESASISASSRGGLKT